MDKDNAFGDSSFATLTVKTATNQATSKGGKVACGGPTVVVISGYERGKDSDPASMGEPLFRDFQVTIDLPKEPCTRSFNVPAAAAKNLPKGRRTGRKP